MKKETWIYWKWKSKGDNVYSHSYIQNVINTDKGELLEIADSTWWTNYPTRVLVSDIDILTIKSDNP